MTVREWGSARQVDTLDVLRSEGWPAQRDRVA
jgi:hypothetical protein